MKATRLSVRSEGGPFAIRSQRVRSLAAKMLEALDLSTCELSILLVNDDKIRELNRTWRSLDRPTDVLSFSMREGEFGDVTSEVLGDVVISIPTAARQAKEAKRTLDHEVTMLLAHGLLHLLGHDHSTRSEELAMTGRTERLMTAALGGGHQ